MNAWWLSSWARAVVWDTIRHPKDHIIGWWGRFVVRDGTMETTAIWLRSGWRVLTVGETVQAGDEFLENNCAVSGLWCAATPANYGETIRHGDTPTYRRKIEGPKPLQEYLSPSERAKLRLMLKRNSTLVTGTCSRCGEKLTVRNPMLDCPRCGAEDIGCRACAAGERCVECDRRAGAEGGE